MLIFTDERPESFSLKAAVLQLPGEEIESPIITGSEYEHAVDISQLRDQTGYTLPLTRDSATAVPMRAR
jgi:hypothetical protein